MEHLDICEFQLLKTSEDVTCLYHHRLSDGCQSPWWWSRSAASQDVYRITVYLVPNKIVSLEACLQTSVTNVWSIHFNLPWYIQVLINFRLFYFTGFICIRQCCSIWTLHGYIGTCRAVWVPRQELATSYLMRNCGKCILSLHCKLYVRWCMHMLYAGDHVSSCPVLVIWVCMIRNNPGLQAPMHGHITAS